MADPEVSEINIDWASIEDKVLRRAVKDWYFGQIYGRGGVSAKREQVRSITGRMSVTPPPYHPVKPRELRDR
jgi:hypothetical protein